MVRTIFMVGLFAMLGLFALRLFFGILPGLLALVWWLLVLALKIALFGAVVYLIVRVLSPDTARKWREKWSGPTY